MTPMKIALSRTNGDERVVAIEPDGVVDLGAVAAAPGASPGFDTAWSTDIALYLAGGDMARDCVTKLIALARERGLIEPLDEQSLRAPYSQRSKLVCIAGNFRSHLEETQQAPIDTSSDVPKFFLKPNSTVTGPFDDVERDVSVVRDLDYEGEIGVVIGATANSVAASDVDRVVAGYTAVNDVSGRALAVPDPEMRGQWAPFFDWLAGKSFNTFTPMGPAICLAPLREIEQRQLRTYVNGELRQAGGISDLIFGVREIVAWLSTVMTLNPGDVIATGTPGGVGKPRGQWLQAGDVVEVAVDGVGRLRNRVVDA